MRPTQALGLVLTLVLVVSCAEDIVVGPGDSCTHEGWFGPDRVCPSGYSCNDTASWTCTKDSYGSYAPAYPRDAAVRDAAASDAGLDASSSEDASADDASADDASADDSGL